MSFHQRRSLRRLLKDGAVLYARQLGPLTRPLLYPLFAQIFGIVCWILLAYETTDILEMVLDRINPWVLWSAFVLANLPGLYLFLHGFWRYLLWFCGVNLAIRDILETGSAGPVNTYLMRIRSRSVDYSLIWTFLFALAFLPAGLAMIPIAMVVLSPSLHMVGILLAVVVFLLSSIASLLVSGLFSLVFQTFSYTPGSAGASLVKSAALTSKKPFKTAGVIVITLLATQLVLPAIVTTLFSVTGLMQAISHVLHIGLNYLAIELAQDLNGIPGEAPYATLLLTQLTPNPGMLALELAKTLSYTLVSSLTVPLGACWFALLYADIRATVEAGMPDSLNRQFQSASAAASEGPH